MQTLIRRSFQSLGLGGLLLALVLLGRVSADTGNLGWQNLLLLIGGIGILLILLGLILFLITLRQLHTKEE